MILSKECVSVPTASPVSTVKDISKVYKECYAGQLSCLKKYGWLVFQSSGVSNRATFEYSYSVSSIQRKHTNSTTQKLISYEHDMFSTE